jgi:murein DD-endopeptidase MepM/ murein hydrolase activator NlpD
MAAGWGSLLIVLAACGRGAPGFEGLRAPFEGQWRLSEGFVPADAGAQAVGHTEAGHPGLDWVMPEGTPVLAAHDGVVLVAGFAAPFVCPLDGRRVEDQLVVTVQLALPDGRLETSYAHLSELSVRRGQRVVAGERLGLSGSTGCSSGPHLHFAVARAVGGSAAVARPVDPYGGDREGGWWAPGAAPTRPSSAR